MKKILLLIITFITLTFFIFPAISQAQELKGINKRSLISCSYSEGVSATDGLVLTLDCIPIIFMNLIFWMLVFAGTVAVFLVIFGGFKFMTSGGDPKQVEGARKTLTWAIIGLVVVLLSFAIVRFIADVTNVGCITKFGFTACGNEEIPLPPPTDDDDDEDGSGSKSCVKSSDCTTSGQECRRTGDGSTGFTCVYPCNNIYHSGWCLDPKVCAPPNSYGEQWHCQDPADVECVDFSNCSFEEACVLNKCKACGDEGTEGKVCGEDKGDKAECNGNICKWPPD